MYRGMTQCRGCGGQVFQEVINLGLQYVVDFVEDVDEGLEKAPLHVVKCARCHLVQLEHAVEPDRLYKKFWYRSGINESMRAALRDVVQSAYNSVRPRAGHAVLDIGCNDGTLLQMFPSTLCRVGVDPASELVAEAMDKHRMDVGINDYFSAERVAQWGPYAIITAVAMFYDLDDPVGFLEQCRDLLEPGGVLIVQMNYLAAMLQNLAVDNVCHEHLTYFTVGTLRRLVEKAGLDLAGTQDVHVNGGSFRAYITRPDASLHGYSVDMQVGLHGIMQAMALQETIGLLDTDRPYMMFRNRVWEALSTVEAYLRDQTAAGERIYLYGASTRGSTLMQMLHLEGVEIVGVADRDEKKWGRRMVGTWTPIVPEVEARERATLFMVLPWHFREAIELREHDWLQNGGRMLFPLPKPVVVASEGETQLLMGAGAGVGGGL